MLNCWEAAIRQSHPFLADEYIASERIAIPRTYLSKTKTLVVGSTGQVRGFLCKVEHLIAALFVHPDHQGFGFGRALLDHVQRPGLIVEVYEANLKARAFYHAYGFRHTTSRLHEDTGEALLCLTLDV